MIEPHPHDKYVAVAIRRAMSELWHGWQDHGGSLRVAAQDAYSKLHEALKAVGQTGYSPVVEAASGKDVATGRQALKDERESQPPEGADEEDYRQWQAARASKVDPTS